MSGEGCSLSRAARGGEGWAREPLKCRMQNYYNEECRIFARETREMTRKAKEIYDSETKSKFSFQPRPFALFACRGIVLDSLQISVAVIFYYLRPVGRSRSL